ncbi:aquaporin [Isoptericola sp. b408]|uniref:aquaporin n=1 Tax=Isoptericola sp. b408 TaxID=3064653 RepID=UPI0027138281|nr:aquaporin [Isoptericola sp. b408]MDO8150747.1 aquaporin [Isoptericola sp. b408]
MAAQTVTAPDVGTTPRARLFTRMTAEAFGTFVLVLAILGTATFNFVNQGSIIPIALAAGISLMAVIAAVGHLSGGHFNPAVTFGLTLAGRSRWVDLLPYWVAQLVGGAAAGALMLLIVPSTFPAAIGAANVGAVLADTANGYGDQSPLAQLSQGQVTFDLGTAAIVEVVIAAIFVGVILGVTNVRANITYPAVVIGLTLTALHIVSWLVTNTGLNPARSLASVISPDAWTASGGFGQLWLFLVAPLVGAALAALFARAFAPMGTTTPVEGWGEQPGTAAGTTEAATAAAVASATAAAVTTEDAVTPERPTAGADVPSDETTSDETTTDEKATGTDTTDKDATDEKATDKDATDEKATEKDATDDDGTDSSKTS